MAGSRRQRTLTGVVWAFETSKLTPSETPPPTRPHLPILPKQFYYVLLT